MHELAQSVLQHLRQSRLVQAGERVGVAVSGGADSVALLRILLELRKQLGIVLSVVHFNHGLRGRESDADEAFVTELARGHKLGICLGRADVSRHAAEKHLSVEAAARHLRQNFFAGLLGGAKSPPSRQAHAETGGARPVIDKIATGHTLDDQAETVLMRLIRGTGMRGLAGIYPEIRLKDGSGQVTGAIIRPLLRTRRAELREFLRSLNQPWREDSSNRNLKYTRNRVRELLLPMIEREFNSAAPVELANLAGIAREEESYWAKQMAELLPLMVERSGAAPSLWFDLEKLAAEPLAVRRRVILHAAEQAGIHLDFAHVEAILELGSTDVRRGKQLALPSGWTGLRQNGKIELLAPGPRRPLPRLPDYEYLLPVPGRVEVSEIQRTIEAVRLIPPDSAAGYNPDQLFDPELLPNGLRVRNWRPGDRFWPAHTKSPKKIKELLQERHITGPERRSWPVVAHGDGVVWVRGFPAPERLRARAGREALLIRELPLAGVG